MSYAYHDDHPFKRSENWQAELIIHFIIGATCSFALLAMILGHSREEAVDLLYYKFLLLHTGMGAIYAIGKTFENLLLWFITLLLFGGAALAVPTVIYLVVRNFVL